MRWPWNSRKSKLVLAAILTAVGGALAGEISWERAITAIVLALLVNIGGIAIEDAAGKCRVPIAEDE